MKRIVIKRKEITTYCVVLDLPDKKANNLVDFPELHRREIERLCPASNNNWMDSESTKFEVEHDDE